MIKTLSLINQNCRLAARLISEQSDRPLSKLERTGLAIHVTGCRSCRRYRWQIRFVDQLISDVSRDANPSPALTESARGRIATALENAI